jgi:hypothetical protein
MPIKTLCRTLCCKSQRALVARLQHSRALLLLLPCVCLFVYDCPITKKEGKLPINIRSAWET